MIYCVLLMTTWCQNSPIPPVLLYKSPQSWGVKLDVVFDRKRCANNGIATLPAVKAIRHFFSTKKTFKLSQLSTLEIRAEMNCARLMEVGNVEAQFYAIQGDPNKEPRLSFIAQIHVTLELKRLMNEGVSQERVVKALDAFFKTKQTFKLSQLKLLKIHTGNNKVMLVNPGKIEIVFRRTSR